MRMSNALRLIVLVLQAALGALPQVRADCPQWLRGQGVPGVNGYVESMATWDPDGDGPAPEQLIVAGGFSLAGNVGARNIASWDGQTWKPLGNGVTNVDYPAHVRAMTVFQGKLVIGGTFSITTSNGTANNLAQWDGTKWISLSGTAMGEVTALCVHNGELIVGGDFDTFGSSTMRRLGAFNGASWREFAGGVASSPALAHVYALVSLGDTLYVGGRFSSAGGTPVNNIAAWRNGAWHSMDFGVVLKSGGNGVGRMLAVGNDLFVAGPIELAGGTPVSNIALWNGVFWETAGPGLPKTVWALCYFNGATIAATADGLFQWSGWFWESLAPSAGDSTTSLVSYQGDLYIGGTFSSIAVDGYMGIAKWIEGKWTGLSRGLPFPPQIVLTHQDRIYAGSNGNFDGVALLAWEGGEWFDPFASADDYWWQVTAMTLHEGELVVAGTLFPRDGISPYSYTIARWHDGQWRRIGVAGGNANAPILAIQSYNGDLVIGGSFSTIDQLNRQYLARWDGSAWRDMGMQYGGEVYCLTVFGNSLVLGGNFYGINKIPMNSIASWNSDGFSPMGAGFSNPVRCLAVHQGALYAGGDFRLSGNTPVRGVGKWNGTAWSEVGSLGDPWVTAMMSDPSGLIVSGQFWFGPPYSNGIARWNGSAWSGFGSGISGGAKSIVRWRNEIVCAGSFQSAGTQTSWGFARWSQSGVPDFAPMASSVDATCDGRTEITANLSPDYPPVSFAWKHNGALIPPATNPSAATATLVLDPVTHASDGTYECEVSSSCGIGRSGTTVLVSSCCASDLDRNGVTDDADFSLFVAAYDLLECSAAGMPRGCPADQNRDGVVNDADFEAFLNGYNQLVCPS